MLTDNAIRAGLREIQKGRKTAITLTDQAPRGAGRLLLVIKPTAAEWYVRRKVGGTRHFRKIGTYPQMPLAAARRAFEERREQPLADRSATLADMFAGYVAGLRAAGKPTADQIERIFELACDGLGGTRLASSVEPADIVELLRPIYERGARVQADKFRMYIGAAYRWAMKATHDYRVRDARNWGIKTNPVDAVPRDHEAEGVGERWLSEAEFRGLLRHVCGTFRGVVRTPVRELVALLLLTGQRVREIARLRADQWNSRERVLTWDTTKNGLPHVLPVCRAAAAILDSLKPDADGWLFPAEGGGPICDGTVLVFLKRYAAARDLEPINGRDVRRTWKTLAAHAGLTKAERDLLQNHQQGKDVSRKHYDRWEYLPEKRAAVVKWEGWLSATSFRAAA